MTFATCDNGGDVTDGFDVLVIGAGIAGTTAALAAAERGARVALAQTRRNQLLSVVQLYKALGGGW